MTEGEFSRAFHKWLSLGVLSCLLALMFAWAISSCTPA